MDRVIESAPPASIKRTNTNPDVAALAQPYVRSQQHLLQATANNPNPTAVPPPIAANAGTLGVRHVLCIIGLPERGKPYIARRLQAYLSFFHGAEVQIFNLSDYARAAAGSDANADALLADLRSFMGKQNSAAANNMSVNRPERGSNTADVGSSTDVPPSILVDDKDPRRKNVDSGKVAIIMTTDSNATFKEKWAGTSKERRQWASATLAMDRAVNAKLIFIEVIVNQPHLIEANIRAKRRALDQGETSPQALREHNQKVKMYSRMYVTLQDDGSEDDLSYIKLYNYGGKVVTNRMHGYLRMRIAQFLTTVHTTPHVIYLSRHGQSEYNVLGKIGGNPSLSDAGSEYARRLGAWVPDNVQTIDGLPVRCRLWTSSLQRTILTAEHIPHPRIPLHEFVPAGEFEIEGSTYNAVERSCSTDRLDGLLPTTPTSKAPKAPPSPLQLATPSSTPPAPALPRSAAEDLSADLSAALRTTSPPPMLGSGRIKASSGSSPPTELVDADSEGVWEQMSPRVYRNLDEIFAGEYEGMRYEDIKRLAPDEATLRAMDKIGYRYPRGESYFDILSRLDPLVHEMESYHEPLLIVSHQAVLRVLYSYLLGKPRTSAPKIEIPLHTVMKITYDGWNPPKEERFHLGPEPVAAPVDVAQEGKDGQKNL